MQFLDMMQRSEIKSNEEALFKLVTVWVAARIALIIPIRTITQKVIMVTLGVFIGYTSGAICVYVAS